MSTRSPFACLAALSLIASALAAGCSSQPSVLATEPDRAAAVALAGEPAIAGAPVAGPGFFPLEIGNRWDYDGRLEIVFTPVGGPPSPPEVLPYRSSTSLVCLETSMAPPYVIARERYEDGSVVLERGVRWRQDRDGLFESTLFIPPSCGAPPVTHESPRGMAGLEAPAEPLEPAHGGDAAAVRAELLRRLELARRFAVLAGDAPSAPEGVPTLELTRLAYPLHVGRQWQIRTDPDFASRVVAHETLALPAGRLAGFRVRIESELFGARDRVFFWVSRRGFLAFDFDLHGVVTDPIGNILGEMTIHERRELTRYRIGSFGGPGPEPEPLATAP